MKYLITGGAGYLGHHLCEKLSGHELVVIDKLIYNVKRRWEDNTVFIEDDINESMDLITFEIIKNTLINLCIILFLLSFVIIF